MFVREAHVPPDPMALARALAGRPGRAALVSDPRGALAPADARFSFVTCDPVDRTDAWAPPPSGARHPARTRGWAGFPPAPVWIGLVPYEAGRPLERPAWTRNPDDRPAPALSKPLWNRYAAVARVDHVTGRVAIEADTPEAALRFERALLSGLASSTSFAGSPSAPPAFALRPRPAEEPGGAHVARVREALRLIAQGDIYQVNLARRRTFDVAGGRFALFASLFAASPTPYAFFADFDGYTVAATSPELALEIRGRRLRTGPIKGTRPRGRDAPRDAALARALDADPKERAELSMTIDLHRNDLGRVATFGSVRVLGAPRVLPGRTVWSRVAEVVAELRPGVDADTILRAVLPCGSVTGAPKVRAMEVIASLEPFRRGLYTGAFGYVGGDGAVVLAMAIRTLEMTPDGEAHYTAGGGIVADSDPGLELEETRWKAAQLENLRGMADSMAADRAPESWPRSGGAGTEKEQTRR